MPNRVGKCYLTSEERQLRAAGQESLVLSAVIVKPPIKDPPRKDPLIKDPTL